MPSHCHLLAPAGGWSPTFWMSASSLGDVSGGSEGCPGDKGRAGLSHHRASHGCPRGATGDPSLCRYTAPLHPRSPPGLSKGKAGPGLSRPSTLSRRRDVYRICPHSLQKYSPSAAVGRLGGDTSARPRSLRGSEEAPPPPPLPFHARRGTGQEGVYRARGLLLTKVEAVIGRVGPAPLFRAVAGHGAQAPPPPRRQQQQPRQPRRRPHDGGGRAPPSLPFLRPPRRPCPACCGPAGPGVAPRGAEGACGVARPQGTAPPG